MRTSTTRSSRTSRKPGASRRAAAARSRPDAPLKRERPACAGPSLVRVHDLALRAPCETPDGRWRERRPVVRLAGIRYSSAVLDDVATLLRGSGGVRGRPLDVRPAVADL